MHMIKVPTAKFTEREHNEKVVAHKSYVTTPKVKVTIRSEVKFCLKLCCS